MRGSALPEVLRLSKKGERKDLLRKSDEMDFVHLPVRQNQ